jgi:nucleoside-diphosphate-sugar epimerase
MYIAAMRVLIVGCGYVGKAAGAALARRGHEVFGLRRSSAGEEELAAAGIVPLGGDVTKPASLARLPGPFAWVVNCVSAGRGGAGAYRETYLQGTRHLLAWLRGQPVDKFVYTSSTGVYGQDDGGWVDEASATAPGNETGQILVETEQLLLRAARTEGFPAVVLRVAGIYGPERGYWLRQYLQGRAVIEGQGDRWLNMIHREDVAGCIAAALQAGRAGQVYNAVDDEPATQRTLFEWLAKTLGAPMPPQAPQSAPVQRARGATSKRVSNRKLKTELGYALAFPTFREGFAAELDPKGQPPAKCG